MKIVRAILLVINLLLIAGLLLSSLAGGVAPSTSVLPSLAAFGFLPLLAANALMVVLWAFMRRWEALLGVAAIALRWGMVACYLQVSLPRSQAEGQQPVFTLMSYNVHCFQGQERHGRSTDSLARAFLELVRGEAPDVLCLQEVMPVSGVNMADSLALMGFNHYYGTGTTRGGQPTGTAVYSRYPITYVSRIDNEKLLADLLVDDRRVRVCCIHMTSYKFSDDDHAEIERARHGEVDQGLRATVGKVGSTLADHEREWDERLRPVATECSIPLVMAGDLNEIPSSWLYRQITRSLRDSFRERGMGLGVTYAWGFPQFRIDMVFHNDGLRVLEYRRPRAQLSDHYPVITKMEIAQ